MMEKKIELANIAVALLGVYLYYLFCNGITMDGNKLMS